MTRRVIALLLAAVLLAALPLSALAEFDAHLATAYMSVKFECGCTRYGSGAMIGRYGLITAGHNLFCMKHGKPLETCDFIFGATSTSQGAYKYNGNFYFYSYDTFKNGYNAADDIGYVIFYSPVGDSTGWFGYWTAPDKELKNTRINVYMYSDKGSLRTLYTKQTVSGSKQVRMDEYLDYGEGGPVFFAGVGSNGPSVVAVFTSHSSKGYGYGRRLTNQVINDMKADGAFN